MFHSARIKLTAWYLLIIMVISIAFSVVLYRVISVELLRFARLQRVRFEHQVRERIIIDNNIPLPSSLPLPSPPVLDPELLSDVQKRLVLILVAINLGIFCVAGCLGYFLAGRTLKPIQEMVEEQDRFVADASHELRTPLTALKSSIEVNLRDKKLSLTEAKKLLESNLEEVNHLQALSDGLLELTQHRHTNGSPFKKCFVADILAHSLKKIEPIAQKKNIVIKKEIQNGEILCDPQGLEQVMTILLDNAVKYSPENSVVQIMTAYPDSVVTITVVDQGPGIEANDLPHIFDRFYRADKSRSKENVSGYGLGLSIAKKIVDAHNGSIAVTQTSNTGTTFTVKLPLKSKKF